MRLRLCVVMIAACAVFAQAQAPAAAGRGGVRVIPPEPCVNQWTLPGGCDIGRVDAHDLSGVWTRSGGGGSLGNEVKMTPAGEAKFMGNKPSFGPRMVPPALGNDPMGKCDPLGLVRNIQLEVAGRSFEFAQMQDRVIQFFEWAHQYRVIWTDGRALPNDPEPRWNGYSVGKWEGNTFVVDTMGLDERTWLDNLGHPHTGNMRVQERYARPDRNTLTMTFTLTDPAYYLQPYVSGVKTHRLNPEKTEDDKLETFCVPSEEEAFNKGIRDPAAGKK
jgi:hypothetical protein